MRLPPGPSAEGEVAVWMSPAARRRIGNAGAVFAGLVGASAVLGYVGHVTALVRILPHYPGIKFNTAVCLLVLAWAALTPRRSVRVAAGLVVVLLAGSALLEWTFGTRTGLDDVLFADFTAPDAPVPGRMAANTAVCLLLLVAALVAVERGRTRWVDVLTFATALVTSFAALGFLYGVASLYAVQKFTAMALFTALALSGIALSLALQVDGWLSWVWSSRSLGATMLRRIVLTSALGLPLIGYLRLVGQENGLYDNRFGVALTTYASILTVVVIAVVTAGRLTVTDQRRADAMARLREANEQLAALSETERTRAERLGAQLEVERRHYREAVSSLDDLVLTVHPRGEVVEQVFAGDAASSVLGGASTEGRDVLAVIDERVTADGRAEWLGFLDHVRGGRAAEAECRVRGDDGRVRWVWLRASPREVRGDLLIDIIASDVTERRELEADRERMLRAARESVRRLEDLTKARDEFLAVTGHELKTPLTVIRGYAEILEADPGLDERQRVQAETILRRTRQLSELVGNLFDMARLESGMVELDLRPVGLDEVVLEVVEAHRPLAEEAGLTLRTDVVPCRVVLDPLRFRQVLDNLLSNAVKYSRPGGEVRVRVACDAVQAVLSVADQGIGIPPDELDKVFDRMYRATSAKDEGVPGTGLGLAVTRSLVEAHGGRIEAMPNPEGGTVLEVTLPLAPGNVPHSRTAADEADTEMSQRVL